MNDIHAHVRFAGSNAAVASQVGPIASVVRNSAGDYTITLSRGLAVNERQIEVQPNDALAYALSVEEVSATVFNVWAYALEAETPAEPGFADPAQIAVTVRKIKFVA